MLRLIFFAIIFCVGNNIVAQEYYQVTAEVLNVRDSANRNGAVIGKVYQGDSIYVVNYSAGWSNVKLKDGKIGYVVSKYISSNFQEYSQEKSTQENNQKKETSKEDSKETSWVTILTWIVIISISVLFGGKHKSRDYICDYCGMIRHGTSKPIKGTGCPRNRSGHHLWRNR